MGNRHAPVTFASRLVVGGPVACRRALGPTLPMATRRLHPWLALAIGVATLVAAAVALADVGPGQINPGLGITGNGHQLHPVGRLTQVGNFPDGSALSPDGRFMWVLDAGHGSDDVRVVDVASGQAIQTLPLPGGYVGVAFAPDGRNAYVSGTPKGDSPTEGSTKGDGGDVVHVFSVDPTSGKGTEQNPIALPNPGSGAARTNSFPPLTGSGTDYPEGLAVSPDGRSLVVALNQSDVAAIVDLASGRTASVVVGRYPEGVAFDPQGRAYVSNEFDGTVSVLDVAAAKVTGTITGLGGAGGDVNSHPEGMVADPARHAVYVAVTNRDLIATVDTDTRRVTATVSVGRPEGVGSAPVSLAISPDGHTLYSADSGEDAVAAISLDQRPGPGARILPRLVVRVRSVGQISHYPRGQRRAAAALHRTRRSSPSRRRAYHRTIARLRRRYLVGPHVKGCAGPTVARERVYYRAVLRALDIHTGRGRAGARARARRRRALARARRLPRYARCAAEPGYLPNLPGGQVIGKLPVAAYPTSVQVTPNGSQLLWVAGKGMGAGPNPTYSFAGDKRPFQTPSTAYGTYVLDKLLGLVGALPTPTDVQERAATTAADAQVHPSNSVGAPAGTPVVAPDGGPSRQIKHVFYVVKENRTYDQLFGSDRRGDGSPGLELFDDNGVAGPTGGITPNAHALTRTFPLIDHFYANSEVSVDGHIITSGAYATDYVQKAVAANYSNRKRAYDFGVYPVTFPPNDFIFDQAVKQGVSFRNYGELSGGASPLSNDGRSTYPTVSANTDYTYPSDLLIGCEAPGGAVGNLATCNQDSGIYDGTGTLIGAQNRFSEFQAQFNAQVAGNRVPTLNYMVLPNDHTNGTTVNDYTPQALVADNDLGLGQVVDLISHSPIWSSSAIFVVEDDSQDGADHVDAHRMPAFVISPWAKRGAAVHTRYDQYSMLRTIELIAGLHPLSLDDALATPMFDAFATSADVAGTQYKAIQPAQPLNELNTAASAMARTSGALPWDKRDLVPQALSDEILWQAVRGARSVPPAPGPNASPVEHDRTLEVLGLLRRHANVRRYLTGAGDG